MKKKQNKTQRINAMLASNPELTPREIAKRLKVSPNLVHQVKWKAKDNAAFINSVFIKAGRKKPSKIVEAVQETKSALENIKKDGEIRDFYEIADKDYPLDLVNRPPHYRAGGIETIDFIEAKDLNYRLGNVVKYVTRAEKKGNPIEDLKKARWYLDREITVRERA